MRQGVFPMNCAQLNDAPRFSHAGAPGRASGGAVLGGSGAQGGQAGGSMTWSQEAGKDDYLDKLRLPSFSDGVGGEPGASKRDALRLTCQSTSRSEKDVFSKAHTHSSTA